ncbi:hypothetical protein [Actinomadura madurae]|nr:hypothetical protein [Actinomadura madurae]MCQ0013566.1 hypothetical protein [Actinomadura madurae]
MERPGAIDRRTLAHHIATDVDRAAPLFARILLVRAIWNLRHHRGDHSLWVAKDVASDCPEALTAAGGTARESARILVPGHDAEHDLSTAVAGADRLSSAVRREGDAYARYQLATDPDISIDKKRAGELGDEWQGQRGHVRDALRELPGDLGRGETGSLLLDRALDRVFKRGLYYQTRHYLFSGEPERAWRRRVAGVLQNAARVRGSAAPTGDLAAASAMGAGHSTAPHRARGRGRPPAVSKRSRSRYSPSGSRSRPARSRRSGWRRCAWPAKWTAPEPPTRSAASSPGSP